MDEWNDDDDDEEGATTVVNKKKHSTTRYSRAQMASWLSQRNAFIR